MDVGCTGYKACRPGIPSMARKLKFSLKLRVRTYGRIVCFLVIAALSSVSVWIATSDKQTTARDLTHTFAKNVSFHEDLTTRERATPRFLSKYSTRFNDNRDVFAKGTNFTAVILLTYMRSGSSFTGDLLQQTADSFYVFEPLRMLDQLKKTGKPIQWLNGTISSIVTIDTADVKRQTLIGWLTCNFSMIYAQSFDDLYFLTFGKKTETYYNCVLKNYGIKLYHPWNNSTKIYQHVRMSAFHRGLHEKCLQDLQNVCLASKFRIVKTIRTQMSLANEILNVINESKVINLIRDPRATVISQIHYRGCPGRRASFSSCAKWHCGNVLTDITVKERMLSKSQRRIMTILYEHIVSNPGDMTDIMYKFLGMKFTEKIGGYARMIALGGNITGCTVCEQSWQSRNHSDISSDKDKLLSKYNPSVLLYIQKICTKVLAYYEYGFYTFGRIR